MWTPTAISPLGPVYIAIADALARDVSEGVLAGGERLPTHRALARELGVNVVTITRAYQEAARRGLVEGEVGRGTFVREREERVLPGMPVGIEDAGGCIDLNVNSTACPTEILDLPRALAEIGADPRVAGWLKTGYSPMGFEHHRAAGAAWMQRAGFDANPGQILITSGVQHAMAVVFGAVLEPGDTLLVEELTYPGVRALAGLLRLKLSPLKMDEHGIDLDAFELACKKGLARALYLQPTVQNPTANVMPADRRLAIADLARRYHLPIIEDDTCGYLLPDPPAPIAAEIPELTYFLSSTSKSIASGLRVAYAHVPTPALERVAANLAATTWMTPPLMAELAARFISDGTADRMVEAKRAETVVRRRLFADHLGAGDTQSHACSAHVWLPLPAPWRAAEFVEAALKQGVSVAPADSFVVGRGGAPNAVRLALGRPEDRDEVERALRTLAGLLQSAPTCASLV